MSWGQLVLAGVAVGIGACLQGSIGFGLGVFAAPILVLLDSALVPVPLLFLGLATAGIAAARERHDLDGFGLRWALAGRLPGTVVGASALVFLSERELRFVFGVAILAVVTVSVVGWEPVIGRTSLATAGVVSGFMSTTTSISAPPIALLYQRTPGPRVRAMMAWYLAIGSAMSLVTLWVAGEISGPQVRAAGVLAPCLLVGFALSRVVVRWLDRGRTRQAMLAITGGSACWLIVQSVL